MTDGTTYLFKDWGWALPAAGGCPAEQWSARFIKQVYFSGGNYSFHCEHDDGCRVYVDGQLRVDAWWNGSGGHDGGVVLNTGYHEVKVEYYEGTGLARLELWWRGPGFLPDQENGDPAQWSGEYYGIYAIWGASALRRNEGTGALDHDWAYGPPYPGLPDDHYQAVFRRTLVSDCGRYQFNLRSDDGAKLTVNGQVLIDHQDSPIIWSGAVDLPAGNMPVELLYQEVTGAASVHLDWTELSVCTPVPTPTNTPNSDSTPPQVDWMSPIGNTLSVTASGGTLALQVAATDASGIRQVEFNRWDAVQLRIVPIATDSTPPYQTALDVNTLNMGWNQINAVATDNAGNATGQYVWVIREAPQPTSPPVSATATSPPTSIPATPTTTPSCSFSDVGPSDYFYTAVYYLACHGVISGYTDNTFRPYNNTTRGQLAKIMAGAEGWPLIDPPVGHFTDVPPGSTFYRYIETAYNKGVISGYTDGTFRPGAAVTRGQLSKIIVGAQQWPLLNPATGHFTDVPQTNPFYQFIETAYSRGIISGYSDSTFRWGANATRAQIAKIVYIAVTSPQACTSGTWSARAP
jgi:hypothetical protein